MRIVVFCHSIVSDWNHGNAHFLRGVASELIAGGNEVIFYEPKDGWSRRNLTAEHGEKPIRRFHARYPELRSVAYDPASLDLDEALDGADLVLVHEWNSHDLVAQIGRRRARGARFRLLFHDTHHRAVTDPNSMAAYDLSGYDGVLTFGEVLRQIYLRRGWAQRAWTWHEAADTRLFHPVNEEKIGDLVWIGNWGDGERAAELEEFLLGPVRDVRMRARVYGVRYPETALASLGAAGIEYGGWLPNYEAPRVFGQHRITVHVPRRPYAEALRGIPTIRVFEALACGIPLVSAPWVDAEGLFTAGRDFLTARHGAEMKAHLVDLLLDPAMRVELARHGRRTVLARHTCAHRAAELLAIAAELGQAKEETAHAVH
jgi:spore maturation protein CgeB